MGAQRLQPEMACVGKEGRLRPCFAGAEPLPHHKLTRLHTAVLKGYFPGRSADLIVTMKPNWMMSSRTAGTTHGSPHAYDTHVPILLYGPGWIPVGTYQRRVDVADIAPTLARLLKIAPPRHSEGRVLEYGPGMR